MDDKTSQIVERALWLRLGGGRGQGGRGFKDVKAQSLLSFKPGREREAREVE